MKTNIFLFFLSVLSGFILVSCAPKISVLSEEAQSYIEFKEKQQELYKKAFEEGKNACKREIFSALQSEISQMKDLMEYEKLVKGGYIVPPKVAKVVVPPEVSEDGKKFKSSYIEWIILEDAKFESRSLIERITSKKYHVLVGIFSALSDAEALRDVIAKDISNDKSVVKVLNTTKNSYAVVIETSDISLAEKYSDRYKGSIIN